MITVWVLQSLGWVRDDKIVGVYANLQDAQQGRDWVPCSGSDNAWQTIEPPNQIITGWELQGPPPAHDVAENRMPRMHSTTGRAMRAKVFPTSGQFRLEVLRAIAHTGDRGVTDYGLEEALGRAHQSVSATRRSLVLDGWVEPLTHGGAQITRTNRHGNQAGVWVASPYAASRLAKETP